MPTPSPKDDVLSLDDVAELLGVHPRTVRRWRAHPRRPLPAHRVPGGRRLFFFRSEVEAWLRRARDLPYRDDPVIIKRAMRARNSHRQNAKRGDRKAVTSRR